MRKYLSFFRIRFQMGIQYRTAAAAGISGSVRLPVSGSLLWIVETGGQTL